MNTENHVEILAAVLGTWGHLLISGAKAGNAGATMNIYDQPLTWWITTWGQCPSLFGRLHWTDCSPLSQWPSFIFRCQGPGMQRLIYFLSFISKLTIFRSVDPWAIKNGVVKFKLRIWFIPMVLLPQVGLYKNIHLMQTFCFLPSHIFDCTAFH